MEKGGYWGMKKKLTPAARKRGVVGWLLNAPYLVYSLVFFLIPLIWAAWLSTMEWNLMSKQKNFVGIDNFAKLLTDRKVKAAFINSYRYLVPIVILCFICGFNCCIIGIAVARKK